MPFTAEAIEDINSVCERFNIAFRLHESEALKISNTEAGQSEIVLSLGFWERPTTVQGDFLAHYFKYYLDEAFDDSCGLQTAIIIRAIKK